MKALIILTTFLCSCNSQPVLRSGLEGKSIPYFDLLLVDSLTILNTASIPNGNPIMFFYFSPNCPYCRAQMQNIVDHDNTLKDIRFILLTSASFSEFKIFCNHYELAKYSNIVAGIDLSSFFGNYFKTKLVPYLAIYDKTKTLKQVRIGIMNCNEIKAIALQ